MALLARALGTVVAASQARRQQLQQAHRLSAAQLSARLGHPGWLEDGGARGHMEALLKVVYGGGGGKVVREVGGV